MPQYDDSATRRLRVQEGGTVPQPPSTDPVLASSRRQGAWWPRLALVVGVVAAIALFYATGLNQRLKWEELRQYVERYRSEVAANRALALVVFFAMYVAVAGLSLPVAAWLSLLAGALFGRWLGTAVVILAATLGATLAFLSSRYLFRDFIQRKAGNRIAALNRGVERDGAYYLFTLRLIPAFPFWLVNLGMGLTPMRALTFAGISLIGMLPGTFLYVNAGAELADVRSPRDVVSLPVFGSLALLGVLPLALRKLLSTRHRAAG
jgi:uncharacterized membrane protein YdjX (TVP38/TMEM64 family)